MRSFICKHDAASDKNQHSRTRSNVLAHTQHVSLPLRAHGQASDRVQRSDGTALATLRAQRQARCSLFYTRIGGVWRCPVGMQRGVHIAGENGKMKPRGTRGPTHYKVGRSLPFKTFASRLTKTERKQTSQCIQILAGYTYSPLYQSILSSTTHT